VNEAKLTAGQFLIFTGLISSVAGSLAIIRTGERSVLFLILIPLGIAIWGLGKYLCVEARNDPPKDQGGET